MSVGECFMENREKTTIPNSDCGSHWEPGSKHKNMRVTFVISLTLMHLQCTSDAVTRTCPGSIGLPLRINGDCPIEQFRNNMFQKTTDEIIQDLFKLMFSYVQQTLGCVGNYKRTLWDQFRLRNFPGW